MVEKKTVDLSKLCIPLTSTIRQAMSRIGENEKGIVLLVDESRRLLGTITDGDVRRAILAGQSLDALAGELLSTKATSLYPQPVTASLGAEPSVLLKLMQDHAIHQIPLLDETGRVADLVVLEDLLPNQLLPLQAVIMAGGFGTRLRPLTDDLPKPMLPVGGRPLMELIIEQLRRAGIRHVNITTHYLPEKITGHFGNGKAFGVDLNYITEDRPLGTAGALGLMPPPDEPLLVINGDILTKVDFRSMLTFHQKHEAVLTVGVRQYSLQVPYGVIESDGPQVRQLREKPMFNFLVNAGIYLLEPAAFRYIPVGECFDMTDLIKRIIEDGGSVVNFPIVEYWLDIGQQLDYEQAQEDIKNGRFSS